jgi:hypothetical protein
VTAQRITIVLEPATRDDRPFAVRLRRLLKTLLRSHGVRCVSISTDAPIIKQGGAVAPTKDTTDPL